jgi:hypothetical protein
LDELKRGWFVYLVIGGLFAGMMALSLRHDRFLHAEGEPVAAQIVSLSASLEDWNARSPSITVVAVSEDGVTGRRNVPPAMVQGCKAGDPVPAAMVEGRLRIDPLPCPFVQIRKGE